VVIENATVSVKTKFDHTIAMILAFVCAPFALWYMYVMDASDFSFGKLALPLGLLLITWGIVWTIAYLLGSKEQKTILPYIHDTLSGILEKSPKMGMSPATILSLVLGLAGVAILVIHFVAV